MLQIGQLTVYYKIIRIWWGPATVLQLSRRCTLQHQYTHLKQLVVQFLAMFTCCRNVAKSPQSPDEPSAQGREKGLSPVLGRGKCLSAILPCLTKVAWRLPLPKTSVRSAFGLYAKA